MKRNRAFGWMTCVSALACVATAVAEPGDVSWRLIRPSTTGIPGDYTQSIFIDDDDSPWISGYVTFWEEGGMAHFDGHAWRVLNNVDCPAIGSQIGAPRFNDIVKTDDGVMWIGTGRGLLRFDPGVEPWCVTRFTPSNSGIAGADVSNIDIAPDGTLWMACGTWGGGTQGGLSQYDPATDTWHSWNTSNGLPWWAGWDWVDYVAVQPDPDGGYTVWFGSSEMGLTTYKDGLFVWYGGPTPPDVHPLPRGVGGHDPVDDQGNLLLLTDQGIAFRSPAGEFTVVGGYPAGLSSEVSLFEPISKGRVLLGTYYADVFLWDEAGWTHLGNWGSGSHTYALTEDSTGAFWAGGIGGSSKYENGQWQRYRLTNTGMLDFFSGDLSLAANGDVAMTANAAPGVGGFDILHPDGTWTNANSATYGIGLPWPYPTDNTSAVEFRPNGNLLFAPTNNGLRELTEDGDYVNHITAGYDIEHIAVAGNGRAWASTGRGAAFRENADGTWTQFLNGAGLPVGDIADIDADPADPRMVYIAAQFGVAHTDGVTWNTTPREAFGLTLDTTGHHITAFEIDPDGTMWVGAGLGLHHYDPDTQTYVRYDTTNTPLPSDDIWDIERAPDGSIWVAVFNFQQFPYPGGVAQFKDGNWRVWTANTSPLPHNQNNDLEIRAIDGGYEVWIATASEAVAVITVEGEPTCVADFASDGELNFFDVQEFLAAFSAHDPAADITGEGVFDFFDVQEFLALFAAGCP